MVKKGALNNRAVCAKRSEYTNKNLVIQPDEMEV